MVFYFYFYFNFFQTQVKRWNQKQRPLPACLPACLAPRSFAWPSARTRPCHCHLSLFLSFFLSFLYFYFYFLNIFLKARFDHWPLSSPLIFKWQGRFLNLLLPVVVVSSSSSFSFILLRIFFSFFFQYISPLMFVSFLLLRNISPCKIDKNTA